MINRLNNEDHSADGGPEHPCGIGKEKGSHAPVVSIPFVRQRTETPTAKEQIYEVAEFKIISGIKDHTLRVALRCIRDERNNVVHKLTHSNATWCGMADFIAAAQLHGDEATELKWRNILARQLSESPVVRQVCLYYRRKEEQLMQPDLPIVR